ncbi:MAG: hypothetical protein CMH54_01260 [Myxococcales bacterium]|nr:hypothetical protein [Myxococcales bacterium]
MEKLGGGGVVSVSSLISSATSGTSGPPSLVSGTSGDTSGTESGTTSGTTSGVVSGVTSGTSATSGTGTVSESLPQAAISVMSVSTRAMGMRGRNTDI